MARTAEEVRKDIDAQREQLATALDELRGSIGVKVKRTLPLVAGGTALVGLVVSRLARRR